MIINDLFLTPFKPCGRDVSGYDCFGLFQELCRRRGTPVPEQETPSFPAQGVERATEILTQAAALNWRLVTLPEPGCAVALRIGGWVSHMGMVMDDGETFIHTNEKTGVTVSRLDDPKWVNRIAGFYRYG